MDPTTLRFELIRLARTIRDALDEGIDVELSDVAHMADMVIALDDWIRKGGFLPEEWRKG